MFCPQHIEKNLKVRNAIQKWGEDGVAGVINFRGIPLKFIFSWGLDWEHLSVSVVGLKRCCFWSEMCYMKDIFWPDTEACVQFHPPRDQYVNLHEYCLHIWRPTEHEIKLPPKFLTGPL